MLDCATCSEKLADFLLDELPEAEAVLVHEHLSLCAECTRLYKDLKGTGKSLQAVQSMQPVEGSPEFERAVRAQAVVELANIVAKLPPEKRLRLEARRAARMSKIIERPAPRRKIFTAGLIAAVSIGLIALAAILFYPGRGGGPADREAVATLSVAVGNVEQFYARANEPHSLVKAGKNIYAGDCFLTLENGRARFDFNDGSSLFLGPSSRVTFRVQSPGTENFVIELEKGEAGVQRPRHESEDPEDDRPKTWDVRSEVGSVLFDLGSHAYIQLSGKTAKTFEEVCILRGAITATSRSGAPLGAVHYGYKLEFSPETKTGRTGQIENARVPAWRMDLVSVGDLARLLAADVSSVDVQNGTVVASMHYDGRNTEAPTNDFDHEPQSNAPAEPAAGPLKIHAGTRIRHIVPFAPPLSLTLYPARESQSDSALAFGALESSDSGVAVDIGREAKLQISEKGRTVRFAAIPFRASAGRPEWIRLDIAREGAGFSAQLQTPGEKSNALPVPKEAAKSGSGTLWIQALGDALGFDNVKITGVVPTDWLRERLSKY